MELLAATKDGILIMDVSNIKDINGNHESGSDDERDDWANGKTPDSKQVKIVARIPSPDNAVGHEWNSDGKLLASVCDEGVRVYDADHGYDCIVELPRVAPDVSGRTGGVRRMQFSPTNKYMVTYEKWDPQYQDNVHVWALAGDERGKRLHSCSLRGYTSGALPVAMIKWTFDESRYLELVLGEGIMLRKGIPRDDAEDEDEDGEKIVFAKKCSNFELSPFPNKDSIYCACFIPEAKDGGLAAHVHVYRLGEEQSDFAKPVAEVILPAKVKDCKMLWNSEGSALLVLAASDVDETGSSYFGTTYLHWMLADGSKQTLLCGAKEGLVQDLSWSPGSNEFMAIVGMLPAKVNLYDGTNGKLLKSLGPTKRNTLKWNPFGRFVAVGGFGTLPGDLDFYDRSTDETMSSIRASLTVNCEWSADGRSFMTCTVAPRMNEGNQISVYRYTGEKILQIDYKPSRVAARHEDTGAGARTKTQALLFAASWRPRPPGVFEDQPESPRAHGRRSKGLPDSNNVAAASATAKAYRPGGYGGGGTTGGIAAMMRGEVDVPPDVPTMGSRTEGWGDTKIESGMTAEELRLKLKEKKDADKAAKKAEEEAEKQAKIDLTNARKAIEKGEKNNVKLLAQLREEIEALEGLKEKGWDELTEEEEEELDREMDMRAQLVDLEKLVANGTK